KRPTRDPSAASLEGRRRSEIRHFSEAGHTRVLLNTFAAALPSDPFPSAEKWSSSHDSSIAGSRSLTGTSLSTGRFRGEERQPQGHWPRPLRRFGGKWFARSLETSGLPWFMGSLNV